MMKTFDLGRFRRARVWIDTLPDATYRVSRTVTRTLGAVSQANAVSRRAAVELFVPRGARSMYGLIGGQFEAGKRNDLVIEVGASSLSEHPFVDSLASKVDEVRTGLPEEYVGAIFSAAEIAKSDLGAIASGKVSIYRGAHGVMASSEAIYKNLSIALLKVFNCPSGDISEPELVDILSREVR